MDLKKAIVDSKDIKEEKMEVPEWGVTVLLRGLTGDQRATILSSVMPTPNSRMDYKKLYSETIVYGMCDPETRQPIFTPTEIPLLMAKSGGVIETISSKIMSLSGMTGVSLAESRKN
jgi:hypothetical protein